MRYKNQFSIVIVCDPSHIGIKVNEYADIAAKTATTLLNTTITHIRDRTHFHKKLML
jgi:hypothetical protein